MVRVARDFFACPLDKLNLTIGDGRQLVNRGGRIYDAILLDAFLGDSSPSHLMTQEAFGAMRKRLKPEGVLVINSFGSLETGHDFLTASLYKTLQRVFRSVRIHAALSGNVFFVASPAPKLVMYRQFDTQQVHPLCRKQVAAAFAHTSLPDPQSGIVLTDDYNPADYYDAANRENLRRQLAAGMRRR